LCERLDQHAWFVRLVSNEEKLQPVPLSRKRATTVLAIGGYVNTSILVVQGLLLIPLYLQFVGAHLYGLWLASGGILGMLGVLNFGIGTMLVQRIANAYGQEDLQKAGAYFINGMLVYLLIVFAFTIAGLLSSFFLSAVFTVSGEINAQLKGCFQLAVVAAAMGILNECLRSFAQALLRPVFSMVAIAISRILGIAITVILLFRGAGLWALPLGSLVAEVLILIAGLAQAVSLFRSLRARVVIDGTIIKEYVQVGGTMFLAILGSTLSREADPLLITLLLRPELTTAYMLTRRAADIVSQMLAVLYGATHSAFSHLVGRGSKEKTAKVATTLLVTAFFSGLIGFVTYTVMNHSFVTLWVGESFALGQGVIFMLGIAFFAGSLRNMVWQLLNGFGEYQYASRVILLEGAGKTLLAAALLHYLGVAGMPIALLLAGGLCVIALFVKLKKHLELSVSKPALVSAISVAIILFLAGEIYANKFNPGSWIAFALAAGGVVFGVSMLCALSNWALFKALVKEHL
jgi:O-antigen/teichoic acid export membrane protein